MPTYINDKRAEEHVAREFQVVMRLKNDADIRTEAQPRAPFGDYGIRKAAIEAYLMGEARRAGFPATVLRPRRQ